MRVAIIGSGMAGLTAGCCCVREGHDVTIFEQFHEIGGVTATIEKDGYKWDLGPLLIEGLGRDEYAGSVLVELGVFDKIRIIQDDRGQTFPDFDLWKPEEYGGPYWRRDRLKELFPADADGLDRYYEFYDQMMDLMALYRASERQSGLPKWLTKLSMMRTFGRLRHMRDWNAARTMEHFFSDEKLKAVFTAGLADFGVLPDEYQGLVIPASNPESAHDKRIPKNLSKAGPRPAFYYIAGGCGELVKAMADTIRSKGGTILTNTPAKRILVESNRVRGILPEYGNAYEADVVIASGGARECFFQLVGRDHLTPEYAQKVENTIPMESVLMVHLGLDFDPSRHHRAALGSYLGTYDVEGHVLRCKEGRFHEGRDGFLIYIPSMHSPSMAPPSHHAVTVYTLAPNRPTQGNWCDIKEEMADKLLAFAQRIVPGLREHATTRVILTPEDFSARTHLKHHSYGGLAPITGHPGPPHKTPVKGLWFVGAQSEGLGGIPNVISATARVAKKILR